MVERTLGPPTGPSELRAISVATRLGKGRPAPVGGTVFEVTSDPWRSGSAPTSPRPHRQPRTFPGAPKPLTRWRTAWRPTWPARVGHGGDRNLAIGLRPAPVRWTACAKRSTEAKRWRSGEQGHDRQRPPRHGTTITALPWWRGLTAETWWPSPTSGTPAAYVYFRRTPCVQITDDHKPRPRRRSARARMTPAMAASPAPSHLDPRPRRRVRRERRPLGAPGAHPASRSCSAATA